MKLVTKKEVNKIKTRKTKSKIISLKITLMNITD